MSVLALVTNEAQTSSLVAAGQLIARALETDLCVLCFEYSPVAQRSMTASRVDASEHPIIGLVFDKLDELQTDIACEEHEKSACVVRLALHPNALKATIEEISAQDVEIVVASAESTVTPSSKRPLPDQLSRHVPCNLSLVTTSGGRSLSPKRVLAVATESADDRSLVAYAHRLATAFDGELTVAVLEAGSGKDIHELGERELQSVLKGAGIEKDDRVKTVVVQTDDPINGIISIADDYDVVVLASGNLVEIPRLLNSTYHATISIFRKAAPIRPWHSADKRLLDVVPALAPADYADLVQNLRTGSRWNADFRIMLGLAVSIASLGLLLNSATVIIGSMLLAPLMTPMLGLGLALVQGNARLARTCTKSVGLGILIALGISFLLGFAHPGDELTPELSGRGSPNILDLLIALLSAAAAAYALARPTLAGSIAGVAIATALVPPLCTAGISLADLHFDNAVGAGMLFATNFLAIVIATAVMFRWMGLAAPVDPVRSKGWVHIALVLMLLAMLILTFPLSHGLLSRLQKGVSQVPAAPLSEATYGAIQKHVDRHPDVSIVFGVRRPSSIDRPVDYRIVVASEAPLPRKFADDVAAIVREQMADETLRVEVIAIPKHWKTDAVRAETD